jgi:hypothetical protein
MRLNELSVDDLSQRLRSGLQLVTGPFTFRIVSSLPDIAQGLAKLYGEFQLSDEPFADFHVRIDALGGPRRFYHPRPSSGPTSTPPSSHCHGTRLSPCSNGA